MSKHYILTDDRKAVECNLMDWAKWLEMAKSKRVVRQDTIDGVLISTVFLGLDHQWGEGPPLIFETMIFNGEHDGRQERSSTWDEAEEMHKQAVRVVKGKGK
jgi:hypothetical protein